MHLLRLEDGGEFSLVEYVSNHIPPYAILSHTWGADHEEVTFKDLTEGTGKNKAGYRKLTFCGKQAANDGLQFFWVDTCCINKSSSAELSEAINSMFRWYHNAAKCYVYLSDVSISGTDGNDPSSQRIWKPAIQYSRWFTRGWTLQELVAPTSVKFFSAEGKQLGDKISLVQEIHNITGISIQALQGSPLSQFSIEERMSWAEGREAKREEDAAYSLLGIFDIHLPLIYGEGREKAFIRLHREIAQSLRNEPPALPPKLSTEQLKRKHLEPSFTSSSSHSFDRRLQSNAFGGTQNNSTGSGPQFSGDSFHAPVTFHQNYFKSPTINDTINTPRPDINRSVPSQSFDLLLSLRDSFFRKSRNQAFTGRISELERITRCLSGHTDKSPQGPLRVVVHGLGGVGKTQLVTEYCHRLREQLQTSIFWFTTSGPDKLESQYKEQAQYLCRFADSRYANGIMKDLVKVYGHPGSEIDLVRGWIASHDDWLLVMDNFDNISMDVDKFIPASPRGKVIFTSRDRRSIGHVARHGFELKSPEPSDAGLLFLRLCNREEDVSSEDFRNHPENIQIERIVESLESFPLALGQAAAYIRLNDPFTYTEYLELLTDQVEDREVLLRFKTENPEYPESVMTTWEISLDFLKKTNPKAAELVQLLGFFTHFNIPVHILHRATEAKSWRFGTYKGRRQLNNEQRNQLKFLENRAEFAIRLSLLVSLSLVSKDISPIPTISVHPLVHEWIRVRLKPNPEELARLANLSGLVVYQAYPLNMYAGFVEWSATDTKESMNNLLHPHLLEVLYNVHQYEPHSLYTPAEVRTIFLAALLSQIARPGRCGEFERRLGDFQRTYTSVSAPAVDYLGHLQKRLVETLGSFEFPLGCESWLQAAKGLESCLSSPSMIPKWTQATAIYTVVFVSLVVAITDTDLGAPSGFTSFPTGTTNQNADVITLQSCIKDYKVRILRRLLDFLSLQGENVPDEILFLQTVVKGRLGDILTVNQYRQLQWPFLAEGLHSKYFAYLGIRTAVAYFNRVYLFPRKVEPTGSYQCHTTFHESV